MFDEQRLEIKAGGGVADVLTFSAESPEQHSRLMVHFDRAADYGEVIAQLAAFKRGIGKLTESEARRRLAVLRRDIAAINATDFFPGPSREQAESALADAEAALNAKFSPDEPHATGGNIRRRNPREYKGRLWVTRERLWVDRVCCAWLIRRFIDKEAKLRWIKRLKDCPREAVGFDFDGAEFTHVGPRVSFEVLLAAFGLEEDGGLARLGALVHQLDTGGVPVPEAPGFAAILAGARSHAKNDDALLKSMTPVLDHLYTAYSAPTGKERNANVRRA